ncbi:MAG: transglutaminase-like cysteine peptidase [Desulfatiglandales bacterium]
MCLALAGSVFTKETFRISEKVLKEAETGHGKDAVERLIQWQNLIRGDTSATDLEKLEKVNTFFNETILFVSDIDLYGVKDYWATPIEFLAMGAGDCEDFAIAKFFTLKALGIGEDKLNITYVKALQYNIAHMVLSYYSEPGAEPLILDNLVDSIKPAGRRTDLLPVFSFNGTGLWSAKQRGQGKPAGSGSSRLKHWRDLQERMSGSQLK